MKQMFTNDLPVSAFAAAGVCVVKPISRVRTASAAASPLAARAPQAHQVQILPILAAPKGTYMGPQTKSGIELDGFRGVPPRGRPV